MFYTTHQVYHSGPARYEPYQKASKREPRFLYKNNWFKGGGVASKNAILNCKSTFIGQLFLSITVFEFCEQDYYKWIYNVFCHVGPDRHFQVLIFFPIQADPNKMNLFFCLQHNVNIIIMMYVNINMQIVFQLLIDLQNIFGQLIN